MLLVPQHDQQFSSTSTHGVAPQSVHVYLPVQSLAVPPPCVPHMAEADATKATRRSDLSIMFVRYVFVEVCAYTARAWRGVNAHDHTEGRARVGECPSSSRALGNSECRDLKPATRTEWMDTRAP